MRKDDSPVEVVRRQFRNGEPALPLRHWTRAALQRSTHTESVPAWVDDVLMVISELVQNVTQHTDGDGELIVSLTADAVLVEVGDTSITAPRTRHPEPDRPGGRGLLMIEAISDTWGVRTCAVGKVVWAQLPAIVDRDRLSAA